MAEMPGTIRERAKQQQRPAQRTRRERERLERQLRDSQLIQLKLAAVSDTDVARQLGMDHNTVHRVWMRHLAEAPPVDPVATKTAELDRLDRLYRSFVADALDRTLPMRDRTAAANQLRWIHAQRSRYLGLEMPIKLEGDFRHHEVAESEVDKEIAELLGKMRQADPEHAEVVEANVSSNGTQPTGAA